MAPLNSVASTDRRLTVTIAMDTLGLVPAVVVTAANIQDRDGAHHLLAALRARFSTIRHVWAEDG